MDPNLTTRIEQAASQCVKCGLCLPHCPTYSLLQHEAESPRGRIALMKGLATGQLKLDASLQSHLDHCLTCRACEIVCPADVSYGELIDDTRALIAQQSSFKKPKILRGLFYLVQHPRLWSLLRNFLYIYQRSYLQKLLRKIKILNFLNLARAESLLPTIKIAPLKNFYPAVKTEVGRIALFSGCINNLFDQETLQAAIKVLTHVGYAVYVPSHQTCCGALHLHAGEQKTALTLAEQNQKIFSALNVNAIISCNSGCTAVLQEYYLQQTALKNFSTKIFDLSQFLMMIDWPSSLTFQPLPVSIALHTPCTLKNTVRQSDAPYSLLSKIPQLKIHHLTFSCCGAAGSYMLDYPTIADNLGKPIVTAFEKFNAKILVTSNIGCSLHLSRLLHMRNSTTKVLHPITLLAQQLIT